MKKQFAFLLFVLSVCLLIPVFSTPAVPQSGLRWATSLEQLGISRANACWVQMSDGRVLIAGGASAGSAVASVEIFDTAGKFSQGAPMSESRSEFACAL